METRSLVIVLLNAGRAGAFDNVRALDCAGSKREVISFSAGFRDLWSEVSTWSVSDRVALAKAAAVLEDTVGGIGSPTVLDVLLPSIPIEERYELAEWIFEHTTSFQGYGYGGVKGLLDQRREQELRRLFPATYARLDASQRAANEARRDAEKARDEAIRRRKVEEASAKLFNAVRRGDVLAVAALLSKGASPFVLTPDGGDLVDFAVSSGCLQIAYQLGVARESSTGGGPEAVDE